MKYTAYINYSADVEGVKFNSLEPEINDPLIESLLLKMTEDQKKISLEFVVNTNSIEQARELTREVADKAVVGLCFLYNAKIGTLLLDSQRLEAIDANGNKSIRSYGFAAIGSGASSTVITFINTLDSRFTALIKSDSKRFFLYKQFGFAMRIDDPVARYMLLYSILLQTKNDWQAEVEDFIRLQEPSVEESKPPERPRASKKSQKKDKENEQETIYTRLRNETGHVRKGATFEETCRQMESKVQGLERLTRLAIEEFQPLE
jgi:hypothetical protein